LLEASLLGLAAVWSELAGQPLLGSMHWRTTDAILGIVGAIPLFLLFQAALASSWAPMITIRRFLEDFVRPFFGKWSVVQLAVISALAGVSEEIFFRGALQGGLTQPFGVIPAILVASVIFGFCHLVNRAYAILAGFIGVYFSVLWVASGNLLTPIVTHAVYDFIALVYFLRIRRPNQNG